MRAHHDEIAPGCFPVLKDTFGCIAVGNMHSLTLYAVIPGVFSGVGKDLAFAAATAWYSFRGIARAHSPDTAAGHGSVMWTIVA